MRLLVRLVPALLLAITASVAPLAAQNFDQFVAIPSGTVALTHAKVIDGTGAPAMMDQTILLAGDRITAIGPSGSIQVPDNANVVDVSGKTIIPGLVGLHNHSYYTGGNGRAAQLSFSGSRLYLASGVTTIRTTGAQQPYAELNLQREIEAGRVIGPTMYATGPYLTGEQGPATMTRLEGPEQARRVVRYWAEEGISWFKAYTWISRAELGAAIEEAHRNGVQVTAHLCSVGYREAVALGIDNLEHGLFANSEYDPNKQPDECPPGFRSDYANLDVNGPEVQATFRDMIDNLCHGGKIAMLGIPSEPFEIDWNKVVFNMLTIKGIYGREMYETWYKMTVMLQSGLDLNPVITHRFDFADFEKGFEVMNSGQSGKVILNWT